VDSLDLFLHDVKTNFGKLPHRRSSFLINWDKTQVMNMKCCGHDVLWQGKKDVFDRLKNYNKEYIKKSGIDTLVTSCGNVTVLFRKITTWG